MLSFVNLFPKREKKNEQKEKKKNDNTTMLKCRIEETVVGFIQFFKRYKEPF